MCDQLTADPDIDASEIEVSVQNGEVTVDGTVSARSMKRAVEDCVESISGVRQMHNRLRVESRDDSEDGYGASAGRSSSKGTEGSEGQRSGAGRNAH